MHVTELFSIPIFRFALEQGVTKEELDCIKNLERRQNQINQSTQNAYILDLEPLSRLKNFLQQCITEAFNTYARPVSGSNIRITQSWANYTNHNEGHHVHNHANSYLSGVFYVQTLDTDQILFENPNNTLRNILKVEQTSWDPWNSDNWWLPAKQNVFIVFPSWLMHEVKTKDTEGERISIAVNTFLNGDIGSYNNKTQLKI